jgi:predicted amidohydrolase
VKIALAQMTVGPTLAENLDTVERMIDQASRDGAQLVLFPECCLTGYMGFSIDSLDVLDPKRIHDAVGRVQRRCAERQIAAVTGQYVRRCGRWYNNAVFIDSDGSLALSYDKTHLVDADCYYVEPGHAPASVHQSRLGVRISLGICHDIRYPEHVRMAALRGSQLHCHLFYGARNQADLRDQEVYDAHLTTRAAENRVVVLAANASEREQMVRSQARDCDGRLIARAESWQAELLLGEVDVSSAGLGWLQKRRQDLYVFEAREAQAGRSYFERGLWARHAHMIEHDRHLLE